MVSKLVEQMVYEKAVGMEVELADARVALMDF
jgi:hypothetical protein